MILETIRDASTGPAGHILLSTIIVAVGLMLMLKSARFSRPTTLQVVGTVAGSAATIIGLIYLSISVLR